MRKTTWLAGLLALMLVGGTAVASHQFSDVPESHVFHDDIGWMYENGITYGYEGTGRYGPEDEVTRGQMAAFMHRLYDRVQLDIPDVPSLSDLAVEVFNEIESGGVEVIGVEGPQGEPGQDGKDGVDGEDGRDGQDGVSGYSVHGGEVPLAPGDFKVTKECKDGKVAIGGGFRVFVHGQDSREDVAVTVSSPGELVDTENGWIANAWEVQGHHAGSQNATLDVQVICAEIAS